MRQGRKVAHYSFEGRNSRCAAWLPIHLSGFKARAERSPINPDSSPSHRASAAADASEMTISKDLAARLEAEPFQILSNLWRDVLGSATRLTQLQLGRATRF